MSVLSTAIKYTKPAFTMPLTDSGSGVKQSKAEQGIAAEVQTTREQAVSEPCRL